MAVTIGQKGAILTEKRGKTLIITMNRPEKMNMLTEEDITTKARALLDFQEDPELLTCIITGAGDRAFTTGEDMKFVAEAEKKGEDPYPHAPELHLADEPGRVTKPVLAAINGWCVGHGIKTAFGCDIWIASENAKFRHAELRIGIMGGPTEAVLPRLIPPHLAMEFLLTGRDMTAQEAYRIGLVNRVVPLADLMPTALAIADEINQMPPLAVRKIKETIRKGMYLPLEEATELGTIALQKLVETEDAVEGASAFVEKRKPVWKNK